LSDEDAEVIHLKGITKKGKQRIQEHGAVWVVVEKRPGTFEVLLYCGQLRLMIYVG